MLDTQRPDIAKVDLSSSKVKESSRFYRWFNEANAYFEDNYQQAATAFDYFEGVQFTEAEMETLRKRNQPPTVMNKVRVSCELVMGIYDKTRMDSTMLPRGKDENDWATAQGLTHASKYIEDTNMTPHDFRLAFRDQLIAGVGWMESSLTEDPTREELVERYVDWREVRQDPLSKQDDYDDARYLFRVKWMHLEEAKSLFPDHAQRLEEATGKDSLHAGAGATVAGDDDFMSVPEIRESGWRDSDWTDSKQDRVLMLECWYYKHERASFIRDKRTGRVVEYDPKDVNDATAALLLGGTTGTLPVEILKDRPVRRCRQALLLGPHVLEDNPSPFQHGRIPFTPFRGWKSWRDCRPVGLVEVLKDPQDAANKALSKLILALSTNQVIMEEGAGDVELLRKEAAKPNGFLLVKRNALRENRFRIERNQADAASHQAIFEMFHRLSSDMAGGLELQGMQSNAASGRAIALRQEQGHTSLSTLFENFRYSKKRFVEMRLANIQHFWKDEKYIRISELGDPDRQEFIVLNEKQEDGTIRNDISALKVDVVIDEQAARTTVRQAFAERLMDFLTRMPDPLVAMSMMDVVVDLYDLPDRPVIKQRIIQAQQMMGIQVQQQMEHEAALEQQKQVGDTAKTQTAPPADMEASQSTGVGYDPAVMAKIQAADSAAGNIQQGR